jgi:hypothetical protein
VYQSNPEVSFRVRLLLADVHDHDTKDILLIAFNWRDECKGHGFTVEARSNRLSAFFLPIISWSFESSHCGVALPRKRARLQNLLDPSKELKEIEMSPIFSWFDCLYTSKVLSRSTHSNCQTISCKVQRNCGDAEFLSEILFSQAPVVVPQGTFHCLLITWSPDWSQVHSFTLTPWAGNVFAHDLRRGTNISPFLPRLPQPTRGGNQPPQICSPHNWSRYWSNQEIYYWIRRDRTIGNTGVAWRFIR